jgi:hypothetical protein
MKILWQEFKILLMLLLSVQLKKVLLWTWCLPQTILGALFFVFLIITKNTVSTQQYKEITLVKVRSRYVGGLSLGAFNFVSERCWKERIIKHEYGHTKQSFILGPTYLIAVGVPSLLWAGLACVNPYTKKTYFTRYPENWADKIGE